MTYSELPDRPGWQRRVLISDVAIYLREFRRCTVMIRLVRREDLVMSGRMLWTPDSPLFATVNRSGTTTLFGGNECPFDWAESEFGKQVQS